ncbi:MAG: restriction endonuclease subunit S [Deltaproteobacteria bacterium]|nr:restriction endonuclease subunit S [Deltaproteobacteria bacterium]MBI3387157.1 restriction endonuclease subunit S [Deltaproteobacteria bacterium]
MKSGARKQALTPALSQGARERSELPDAWAAANLAELATRITKGSTPTSYGFKFEDRGVRFVKVENIRDGSVDQKSIKHHISQAAHENQRRSMLEAGDILISIAGTIGATCLVTCNDVPANTNQALAIIRGTQSHLTPQFLRYQLSSALAEKQIDAQARGGGMNNISLKDVGAIRVLFPPLAEQQRIVAQVEVLLAHVNAARERLAKVPAILKRFRQSVLAAACSGRLTEEWRESHPDVRTDPRACRKPASTRQRGRRGANLSLEGELPLDEMPELPSSWEYYRADEVAEPGTVITYGIVLPGPEFPDGVPYVRQQDVLEDGTLNVNELRHTKLDIAQKHSRSSLKAGDVLLCIIRNLRVATVPTGIEGANITQGMVRIRPATSITTEYLAAYLACVHAQSWLKDRYFGMDMPRVNVEDARAVPIALPPLAEQHEIVRRIDALFKLADAIEQRIAASTMRAEKLTQAILAKAFRGELVPTEAELARREGRDYEPASVLLDRIRVERTREPSPRPSPRGRGSGAGAARATPHSRQT